MHRWSLTKIPGKRQPSELYTFFLRFFSFSLLDFSRGGGGIMEENLYMCIALSKQQIVECTTLQGAVQKLQFLGQFPQI